jgi:hypothetical protein
VSTPSRNTRNVIRRSPKSAMVRVTSTTERSRRSMAVTTTVLPARAYSSIAVRPGRAVFAEPESLSVNTRSVSTPAAVRAVSCASRSWPVVLTRAYPRMAFTVSRPAAQQIRDAPVRDKKRDAAGQCEQAKLFWTDSNVGCLGCLHLRRRRQSKRACLNRQARLPAMVSAVASASERGLPLGPLGERANGCGWSRRRECARAPPSCGCGLGLPGRR